MTFIEFRIFIRSISLIIVLIGKYGLKNFVNAKFQELFLTFLFNIFNFFICGMWHEESLKKKNHEDSLKRQCTSMKNCTTQWWNF